MEGGADAGEQCGQSQAQLQRGGGDGSHTELTDQGMSGTGPGLRTSRSTVADPDGRIRWTVVDAGPGIGHDEQTRLFERFFVGTSDRRGDGSGLGLPTALAIAQAHGERPDLVLLDVGLPDTDGYAVRARSVPFRTSRSSC